MGCGSSSEKSTDAENASPVATNADELAAAPVKEDPAPEATASAKEAAPAPAPDAEDISTDVLAKIAANKVSNPGNRACKHFDQEYYNTLAPALQARLLKVAKTGADNPDSGVGAYAMYPDDYDVLKPFLYAVIKDYHKIEGDVKHVTNWDLSAMKDKLPEDGKLDLTRLGLGESSMRVRVGRNLASFPLPGAMNQEDRVKLELEMCTAFDKLIADPAYGGGYNSLTPGHPNKISEEEYQKLVDDHIMFKDMAVDPYLASAGISSDWPYGRGCYVSEDREFIVWVGEEDHLRIMCMKKGTVLNEVFDRLEQALKMVEENTSKFAHSADLGYVTSCPTNLGTGMRASIHVKVPNLTSDGTDAKAKAICKPLGLSVRGTGGEHTPIGKDGTIDVSPSARLMIQEAEIIVALYEGIKQLLEAEQAAVPSQGDESKEVGQEDESKEILAKIEANKVSNPGNRACKHFDQEYYNSLAPDLQTRLLKVARTGADNPDSGVGAYAMYPDDYDVLKPFLYAVIKDYHKIEGDVKHVTNWDLSGMKDKLPEDGKLDLTRLGLDESSMRVRVGRNLASYPLPGAMNQDDRVKLELEMCSAFDKLIADPAYGGGYNSLTPGHPNMISQEEYQKLVDEHLMFKDMAADPYLASAGISSNWPYGRGCYVSEDREFIVWVGEEDHLRIMCMKKGTVLNEVFDRLEQALKMVEENTSKFAHSEDLGYVTSCPTNLGTGMRASIHVKVPNLTNDGTDTKAKEICKPLGLSVRGTGGEHTPIGKDGTIDVSPSARLMIQEAEIIVALYEGVKLLLEAEQKATP